jgi:hypothetical protein
MDKINGTLKSLSMPTRTNYYLQGIDQLQILGEKILQCGKYIEVSPGCNPLLAVIIAVNQKKQELDLSNKSLSDSDMMAVTNELRKNTVSKMFL